MSPTIKSHTGSFLTFLILAIFPLTAKNPPFSPEQFYFPFRGLWIVRTSMVSEKTIDEALTFAKQYGFNHVFVQVRGRGDAFYKSSFVPRSPLISSADTDFDPLAYALKRGHEMELKVHAWLNIFLLWTSDQNPKDTTHLIFTHPEWLDWANYSSERSRSDDSLRSELLFTRDSSTDYPLDRPQKGQIVFLSPSLPDVKHYLMGVIREVLENYDIDGLHLDYVRYGDTDFGYNTRSLSQFHAIASPPPSPDPDGPDELNRDGIGRGRAGGLFQDSTGLDVYQSRLSSSGSSPKNSAIGNLKSETWNKWEDFRRESVTDFVRNCNSLILELKPNCIFSAAVKPDISVAKNRYSQEWDYWLSEGLVDYCIVMNYESKLIKFIRNMNKIQDSFPSQYLPGVIMGVSIYNQDAHQASEKIRVLKEVGFSGISLFSYDSRKGDSAYFNTIISELTY